MYIVTAWNGSEHLVRCRGPAEALDHAKELVSKGKRISIVRTSSGESVAVTDLQDEIAKESPKGGR
jgi:hypothetical protein